MPVHITALTPEEREEMRIIAESIFLHGGCHAFAIALHQQLGWPVFGIMHRGEIAHAMLKAPDQTFFDVRGFIERKNIGAHPFEFPQPWDIQEIPEHELCRLRFLPHHKEHAFAVASLLWPELPWKKTWKDRMHAFATALEKLSREHGIWIQMEITDRRPRLTDASGDEWGYVLCPTTFGKEFTIDRTFSDPRL